MQRILIATDGSASTRAAVKLGLDLAAAQDAHVTFLNVLTRLSMTRPSALRLRDASALAKNKNVASNEALVNRGLETDRRDDPHDRRLTRCRSHRHRHARTRHQRTRRVGKRLGRPTPHNEPTPPRRTPRPTIKNDSAHHRVHTDRSNAKTVGPQATRLVERVDGPVCDLRRRAHRDPRRDRGCGSLMLLFEPLDGLEPSTGCCGNPTRQRHETAAYIYKRRRTCTES